MALFHLVRSNPQERSSGRASVSPALVRVARCAFVRRDTRVREVRMVRRVRRAFPGRCRGVRARVRAIEPLAPDATGTCAFFWRRGAIDRRFVGARLQNAGRAQCARSPAFRRREIGRLETRPREARSIKNGFETVEKCSPVAHDGFFFGRREGEPPKFTRVLSPRLLSGVVSPSSPEPHLKRAPRGAIASSPRRLPSPSKVKESRRRRRRVIR